MLNRTPIEKQRRRHEMNILELHLRLQINMRVECLRPTDLQPGHQNMNQHRLHMQRPTFHSVAIHFRRWLEMMSPFCSTIAPQYWQYARMDPEN